MKAVDYFKKMGWNFSNIKLAEMEHIKQFDEFYLDLKQIVDAFDRVMEHGSVELAKKYAESKYTAPEVKEFLSKAINLVEQC